MIDVTPSRRDRVTLEPAAVQQLIDVLRADGYQVFGPTLGNGAIVFGELESTGQLPVGKTDRQQPGAYRLVPDESGAWFGYAVGPHALKRHCYPAVSRLWRAERRGSAIKLVTETDESPAMAFIGVRACEIAALEVQDRVLLQGPHADPVYQHHRERIFVVAVNCGKPGGTCFCVSMGTGPKATDGFDIALTEVMEAGRHVFVAEGGSDRGVRVLDALASQPSTDEERAAADAVVTRAATQMGREVATGGLQARLAANIEHPRWELVAKRCLSCGNCTMACPTCFCTTIDDQTDLSGAHASRVRTWDSCFNLDFSYIHGGSVRPSPYARYRQWLIHKFSTWVDQFGTSGCVGCGRCITWCPVGIDVTEEVRALAGEIPADAPASHV